MRGHVRRRGTTWAVVVDVGRHPETGRRRQKWHSGFRTRKEAERALAEIVGRIGRGDYVAPSRLTVGAFLAEEWLPATSSSIRPSTHASYSMIVRKHITPRIGGLSLQGLGPTQINRMYSELLQNGRRDGKPLSPRSVRLVHATLRKALGDAVRWGRVARNVADLANPPSLGAERASRRAVMKTWTADQVRVFLDHVAEDRLVAAWHVAATTGVRRGELAGLCWAAVDLDAARMALQRGLVSVDYAVVESGTKSGKVRVVELDPGTVAALRVHRRRQAEERLLCGAAYQDHDLVFAREDGSLIHPEQWTRMFRRHVAAAGLPTIRLHDLRHSHATLLMAAGVHPKIVQERLGHHSSAFTMDVYAHVTPAMQAEAAAKFGELLKT